MTEIDTLKARIAELETDNAHLRQTLAEISVGLIGLREATSKLRDMVRADAKEFSEWKGIE